MRVRILFAVGVLGVSAACERRSELPLPDDKPKTFATILPAAFVTQTGSEPTFKIVLVGSERQNDGALLMDVLKQGSMRDLSSGQEISDIEVVDTEEVGNGWTILFRPASKVESEWFEVVVPVADNLLQRIELRSLETTGRLIAASVISQPIVSSVHHCAGDKNYVELVWSNLGLPPQMVVNVTVTARFGGEVLLEQSIAVGEEKSTTLVLPTNEASPGDVMVQVNSATGTIEPVFASDPPGNSLAVWSQPDLDADGVCRIWRGGFSLALSAP